MKKTRVIGICLALVILVAVALTGCTKEIIVEEPAATTEQSTQASAETSQSAQASTAAPSESASQEDAGKAAELLGTIVDDAKQGKVIDCEFAVQQTIDDVKSKWGEPDSDDYVSDADGSYATYTEKGVVFGYNTGAEIFEVRRVAGDVLEEIKMKDIKAALGDPDYTSSDENKNPIVGYQVSDDYKLLFVMDQTGDDSGVDHYNVLWPQGSADLMAGDMGKSW